MKTRIHLAAILLAFLYGAVNAQEFTIKQLEIGGQLLTVHYDLIDTTKNRTYTIFVYASVDNFTAPLTKLTGDAGLEVRPGTNKKVSVNVKEEFPGFEGELELEVRGRVYVPFIRFEGFEDVQIRKRGVPFIVKWSGGTRQNILNFQLYQGERLAHTFPNVANAFEYKVLLPNSVRPGDDYYFRISDTKNRDQVVITPKFTVKRKVPLAVKAIPIVILGAAVPFLIPDPQPEFLDGPPPEPGSKN